jgi:hypothetical protein
MINAGGFAVFLLVAFATRAYRWGFVADVLGLWCLWRFARPAGIRWAREARQGQTTSTLPGSGGRASDPDDERPGHG